MRLDPKRSRMCTASRSAVHQCSPASRRRASASAAARAAIRLSAIVSTSRARGENRPSSVCRRIRRLAALPGAQAAQTLRNARHGPHQEPAHHQHRDGDNQHYQRHDPPEAPLPQGIALQHGCSRRPLRSSSRLPAGCRRGAGTPPEPLPVAGVAERADLRFPLPALFSPRHAPAPRITSCGPALASIWPCAS